MDRVPADRLEANRLFFVTVSTAHRKPVFTNSAVALAVVETMAFYAQRGQAPLIAYVVMPDHLHVLVYPRSPLTISRWVGQVKSYSTHRIGIGTFWQEGCWSEIVLHDRFLQQKLVYVHDNPVRVGLAESPHTYPWSSAAEYYNESFRIVTPYWKIALDGSADTHDGTSGAAGSSPPL
ncbi:MAG TPA: transposase [bacterium]|jgi:putative transposase